MPFLLKLALWAQQFKHPLGKLQPTSSQVPVLKSCTLWSFKSPQLTPTSLYLSHVVEQVKKYYHVLVRAVCQGWGQALDLEASCFNLPSSWDYFYQVSFSETFFKRNISNAGCYGNDLCLSSYSLYSNSLFYLSQSWTNGHFIFHLSAKSKLAILRGTEYDITKIGVLMIQTLFVHLKYDIFTPLSSGRSN